MDRIAELVEKIENAPSSADARAVREDARELMREVLSFHAGGLRRLVELLAAKAPDVMKEAAADPLVASLLELHELSTPSTAATAQDLVPVASLLRKQKSAPTEVVERGDHEEVSVCDLCGLPVGAGHAHVVELSSATVRCSCRACALLFENTDLAGQRYRRVPDDVVSAGALAKDDAWWSSLGLPVGLAFFVRRTEGGAVARYPGPGGAIASLIPQVTWDAIAIDHPTLGDLIPEVQALVVNRMSGARDHWIVGVDRAWTLVARVREHWRGLSGGEEARGTITGFFAELEKRS